MTACTKRLLIGLGTILILGAGPGCGKVGPPRLPSLAVPYPPEPVKVRNVASGIEITFDRPKKYLDGAALADLGSFEVSRSCGSEGPFVLIADIPVLDRDRFQKQGSLTLTDFTPLLEEICIYQVVAVTLDEYRSAAALSRPIERQLRTTVKP